MKTRKATKKTARRRTVRFPGISQAARTLGVSRTHLWYVLTGVRESRSLTRRYEALAAGG